MKKPKNFNEWFEIVYPVSEYGAYDAYEIWSEEENDDCYEFIKKILKIEQLGDEE